MTLQLGTPVTLTDRLVRVHIHIDQPRDRIDATLSAAGFPGKFRRASRGISQWRLWVPRSWAIEQPYPFARMEDDANGDSVTGGIITQRTSLQQGGAYFSWSYDEPSSWCQIGATTAYRIAHDINRRPILATPNMIQEVTP